jgi:hypothetical protein
MAVETKRTASYTDFVREAEPRLRRALCVAFGRELGLEATAEALAWGWEHWDRMRKMHNPTGSAATKRFCKLDVFPIPMAPMAMIRSPNRSSCSAMNATPQPMTPMR